MNEDTFYTFSQWLGICQLVILKLTADYFGGKPAGTNVPDEISFL